MLSGELLHTGPLLSAQVSNSPAIHGICVLLEQARLHVQCFSNDLPARQLRDEEGTGLAQGTESKHAAVWLPLQLLSGLIFLPLPQGKTQHRIISVLVFQMTKQLSNSYPKVFQN